MIISVFMWILHLIISGIYYLFSGYFDPLGFYFVIVMLSTVITAISFISPSYIHRRYDLYEIELSDQFISFRQNGKTRIKIQKDDVAQIREITPEGEIYVRGKLKGQFINVYSLLSRENPEIRRQLGEWRELDTSSLSVLKFFSPLGMVLFAFLTPFLFYYSIHHPGYFVSGLSMFGYSIVGFFVLRKWPASGKTIKNMLWLIFMPAIVSIPLLIYNAFQLLYVIFVLIVG